MNLVGAIPALALKVLTAAMGLVTIFGLQNKVHFKKMTPQGESASRQIQCWSTSSGGQKMCLSETGNLALSGSVVANGVTLGSGGGGSVDTGAVLNAGNDRFVNVSGDTMTGSLNVNVTGGNLNTVGIKVIQTLSGAHVHGERSLTGSGYFSVDGSGSFVARRKGEVPLRVQGAVNQTANMFEVLTSSGTKTLWQDGDGALTIGSAENDDNVAMGDVLTYRRGPLTSCVIFRDSPVDSYSFNPDSCIVVINAVIMQAGLFSQRTGSFNPTVLNFFDAGAGLKDGTYLQNTQQPAAGISVYTAYGIRPRDSGNNTRNLSIFGGFSDTTAASFKTDFGVSGSDTSTNGLSGRFLHRHNSTGTPASGFGSSYLFQLESSTTENQDAAEIRAEWGTATHASRAGKLSIGTYSTSTFQEGLRIDSFSTGATIKIGDDVYTDTSADRVGIGTQYPETKLEVVGALSGVTVFANSALRSSGSLVFEGAASGSSLYLGTSLTGAGLTDCDADNQTVSWDATTGRFGCGDDDSGGSGAPEVGTASFSGATLKLGDERYLKLSGGTLTGATTVNITGGTRDTVGLNVLNAISGAVIRAQKALASSGTLVVEGAMSGASLYAATSINGAGLTDCDADNQTLSWDATTGRFGCGDDDNSGGGAPEVGTASFTGATFRIVNPNFVNVSGDTMTGALNILVTGGTNRTVGLEVFGTASGSRVHAQDILTSSGGIFAEGVSEISGVIFGIGTINCNTSCITASEITDNDLDFADLQDTLDLDAALTIISGGFLMEITGTMSGNVLHAEKGLSSSGTLVWEGAGSGQSLTAGGGTVTFSRSGSTVINANGRNVDTIIRGDGNDNLVFVDASTDRVGLGTSTPEQRLDLGGGGLELNTAGTDIGNTNGISFYTGNDDYKIGFDNVSGTKGYIRFNVDSFNSSAHGFVFSGGDIGSESDIMLIRSDKMVGIGNVAPARNLHVTDTMRLEPRASAPASAAAGDLYVDSTPAADELCFYDGSAWQGVSSGTDANCS